MLLALYGLDSDFDLYDLPNLVPSCRGCNGTKAAAVVSAAPVIRVLLDKAERRAAKIRKRAARFDRKRFLSEAIGLVEAIHLEATGNERRTLDTLGQMLRLPATAETPTPGRVLHPGANYYEPEPPRLKPSKKRLSYNGLADDVQLLLLLEEWSRNYQDDALQVVSDTFDGGDQAARKVSPRSVSQLAYAKGLGDFLAQVEFDVIYLHEGEGYVGEADAVHTVDLWITLDTDQRHVVDAVPDLHNTLDGLNPHRHRPDTF